MGMFLNSKAPYESYKKISQTPYFVDKSLLLSELIPFFDSGNRYCCITRPRRFGKTVMADDLMSAYPDCRIYKGDAVWDALQKIYEQTESKFLFVLDEWDAVFHMSFISEDNRKDYLLFLKWLLKDQAYVKFAYMTGVLPIAKYSRGSELNMFVEYDMAVWNGSAVILVLQKKRSISFLMSTLIRRKLPKLQKRI